MTIEIALFMVALVPIVFAASRVMKPKRPAAVQEEAWPEPPQLPLRRPHYAARRPQHFALPPVTIDTAPINFKQMHASSEPRPPEAVPEMVPPIDRRVLAALVASGSRTAAEVQRPERLARGSIPPGGDAASDLDAATLASRSDIDGAETMRPASDLDDDALTRTNMSPVR